MKPKLMYHKVVLSPRSPRVRATNNAQDYLPISVTQRWISVLAHIVRELEKALEDDDRHRFILMTDQQ
jgi:hypothetical protein